MSSNIISKELKSSSGDSKSSKKKRKITFKSADINYPNVIDQEYTPDDLPIKPSFSSPSSSELIIPDGNNEVNTEDTLEAASKKKKRTRKRQKSKRKEDDEDVEVADVVETSKSQDKDSISTTTGTGSGLEPITTDTTFITDGSDEIDRTVYMEGIPFHATYDQIVDFLTRTTTTNTSQTDTVTTITTKKARTNIYRNEIMEIRLPIWQDTGRYRGYGHVVFTTKEIQQYSMQHLHRQYFFIVNNNSTNRQDNQN